MAKAKPQFAIIGGLREDYFITPNGEAHNHEIGGNALYAAVGAALWSRTRNQSVGLVARVGENYPSNWITRFEEHGFDTRGIKVVPGWHDTRTFYAYLSLEERVDTDPIGHFARVGQPLPPELKDYSTSTDGQDVGKAFSTLAVRPNDVPRSFHEARGLHISPCDYLTQRTMPGAMRDSGIKIVTCDPSIRYMQPGLKKEVAAVVRGLDGFLPSELEVRAFYRYEAFDLWEAAAEFGAMGCQNVVIKRGANGCALFNVATGDRWLLPAYPANVRDVTGAGDAFGGGFMTGLADTGDPVEAALRGLVSASIVIEGAGALNGLLAHPDLPSARLTRLRDSAPQIMTILDRTIAIQQIPAPTFDEKERAEYVAREFKAMGLKEVEIDGLGNVFACRPGGPAKPTLVTAHTDTVFPRGTDLTVSRTTDRVYGPGIGDNSLGVAGLLALVEALNEAGLQTPGDLWLAANVGEEGLGDLRGMREVMRRFGDHVRATLVIEGMSYGHVYHQAIGVHRLRVTVSGEGGHSWHDYGRPSAIHGLVQLASRLASLVPPSEPRTTINIGQISGGTSVNTIAREASLELDLRSEDPKTLTAFVEQVDNLLTDFSIPGLTLNHTVTSQRPAGSISLDHPLIQLCANTLRELGTEPVFEKGSTDANIPLSLGLPATVIGLCHGGNAHRPDEYIETAMLDNGVKQLVRVVLGTYNL